MDNLNPKEDRAQPSVEELRRTRKDRVAARKKKKREQKRAKRRADLAAGRKHRRKVNKLALAVVVVLGIIVFASVRNIMNLRAENEKLQKQHAKLIATRNDLKDELKNVNSREYIEKRAREQLRLVNPDEIIFVFPDEDED